MFTGDKNFTSIDNFGDSAKGVYIDDESLNRLTVISNGDSQILIVANLTATNLHLTRDETSIDDGVTYRITFDGDFSR